jgi:hypothetical protein
METYMRILKLSILLAVLLGAIAPADAQSPIRNFPPGTFQNRAAIDAAPSGGCSQATTFLARNGGVNATDTTTLICGLVTDGVWTKLDALYVFATDTSAHALLNWVSSTVATPATINATMTFTAAGGGSCGYVSSSGGSISTGFNPTTATSPNFVLHSASIGVWDNAAGSGDNTAFHSLYGTVSNPGGTNQIGLTGTDMSLVLNNVANSGPNPPNTVAAGHYLLTVTSTGVRPFYKNGTVVTSGTISGTEAIRNDVITFPGNTSTFASTDPICAAHIGGGLTATDGANLYARLHVYLQNVAAIP